MQKERKTIQDLARENEELRTRLSDAEEALDAIRNGRVDALLVSLPEGERIYTLENADTAYRVLVENMREGAVTLLADGSILYSNQPFANMVGQPLEKIPGTVFDRFVHPEDHDIYQALRQECRHNKGSGEIRLLTHDGHPIPAYLSLNNLQFQGVQSTCLVVTDLSTQKRNERIAEDERLARAILEQAGECIVVCDQGGRIIRASQAAHIICGGNPLLQSFDKVFPIQLIPDGMPNRTGEVFSLQAILDGKLSQNIEVRLGQRGDTCRYFLLNGGPLRSGTSEILGAVITLTDITERKRAEEQRNRSQKTFSELVERAPFGIYVIDSQFRIAQMNAGSQTGAFQNVRPVIGRDFAEAMRILWPEPVAAEIIAAFRHTLETGEPYYSRDFINPRHDADIVEAYEWELHRMTLPDGQYGVICYYFDSTKLREAEAALRENEERFRTMADSLPQLAWTAQPDGFIFWFNQRCFEYTGAPKEQLEGWGWQSVIDPEALPQVLEQWKRSIATGEPFDMIFPLRGADGRYRRFLTRALPLKDAQGIVVLWFGTDTDVDELKRTEDALRESEQRLSLAQQAARIGSFEWNIQTNVNVWTPELEAMYGLQPGEFGRTQAAWEQLVHPEDRQSAIGVVNRAFETGLPSEGEWRVRWRDGSEHWIFGRFQLLRDEAGKPLRLTGVNIDITARKQAEEQQRETERLRESERRLNDIIEFLPDATFALDNTGRIIAWNKAIENLTGAPAAEVLGQGNYEHTYRLYGERIPCLADEVLRGDKAGQSFSNLIEESDIIRAETYIPHHKPGGVWLSIRVAPIYDAQGNLVGVIDSGRDITERKLMEEALRESEQRLSLAQQAARIGSFDWNIQTGVNVWTPELEAMYGLQRGEFGGTETAWEQLVHPEDRQAAIGVVNRAFETDQPVEGEWRVQWPDGSVHWIFGRFQVLSDEAGKPLRLTGVNIDITERKQAEAALQESEMRFRGTFENAAVGMTHIDLNGNWLLVNPKFCEIVGYTREELKGKKYWEITHPDDVEMDVAPYTQLIRGKIDHYDLEKRYIAKDGREVWVYVSRALQRDSEGQPLYTITNTVDITERKRMEEALRQGEQEFRTLAETVPQIVWATRPDGWNIYFNQHWVDYTGLTLEESYGHGWITPFHPDEKQGAWDAWQRATQQNEPYSLECRLRRADGVYRWWLIRGEPIRNANGEIQKWFGTYTDIEEIKQAEEALRKSEERYRTLFNEMDEGFCIIEMIFDESEKPIDYRFLETNPAFEKHTGLIGAQGKTMRELAPKHEEHWFEIYGKIALTGEPARFQNRAEQLRRWYDVYAFRFGEPEKRQVAVLFNDINERKRIEEELKQYTERLTDADRRKDEFMAMLAHELRNPLAPIRYALQVLNMGCPANEHLQAQRNMIDRQIGHMGRLLDDLLEVSRITRGKITLKREIVDLRTVAEQALDSMRPMIEGRGQHLLYEGPSAPLPVDGDPTRLEQVIRNLLHNANKFTEAGGCIKLSLTLETDHEPEWRAVVSVSDSGIGIAPEMLPRIFETFVQAEQGLARSQGGLGIGLAMVQNLVQMHGGRVEAFSAGSGKGSQFTVWLPLATEALGGLKDVSSTEEHEQAAGATPRRVLVVDDNEDAAASLGELLSLWGHEIQTAHDGRHALASAQEWHPEIVLLDIGLPGMDGYEIARHLREDPMTADTFLVALTGYGQEEDRRRSHEAGFDRHLTKPVELEQLQHLLHEAQAA